MNNNVNPSLLNSSESPASYFGIMFALLRKHVNSTDSTEVSKIVIHITMMCLHVIGLKNKNYYKTLVQIYAFTWNTRMFFLLITKQKLVQKNLTSSVLQLVPPK